MLFCLSQSLSEKKTEQAAASPGEFVNVIVCVCVSALSCNANV